MTKKVQVHNINKFNKNAHNIMKQMKNFEKKSIFSYVKHFKVCADFLLRREIIHNVHYLLNSTMSETSRSFVAMAITNKTGLIFGIYVLPVVIKTAIMTARPHAEAYIFQQSNKIPCPGRQQNMKNLLHQLIKPERKEKISRNSEESEVYERALKQINFFCLRFVDTGIKIDCVCQ